MPLTDDAGLARAQTDFRGHIAHQRSRWLRLAAFGAVAARFGVTALWLATAATIASVYLIAIFIIIVGGAEIVVGVNSHLWSNRLLLVSLGFLYVVAGSFALANPLTGAAGFTLLLGAALLATGVARVAFAMRLPHGPSGFVVLAGILTIVLGMVILFGWPENSPFVLGIFLGLDLFFYGLSWMGFGLYLRD
jgi:uncharacterized membrane protein HdeD (DUF308 family)